MQFSKTVRAINFAGFVHPSLVFSKVRSTGMHTPSMPKLAQRDHHGTLAGVMVPARRSSLPPRLLDAFDRAPLR
jgi:hypothetical protein